MGGLRKAPAPGGVPVKMMSPGVKVMPWEMNAIRSGTSKRSIFIITLNKIALDTPLGRELGDHDLSGGEWQKLALARAFVRDCQVLVLDEPTAALDAAAEYQLFARFRDVVAGKTALLISHRFSTVRMADQILVLEGGRIVEAGSHAELVALGGRYATLYEMQAARYRENPGAH
jgi:ATP-binding cassette, subfamily B, bacterial